MTTPSFLPYGTQDIDEDDIEAVVRALRSDFLTTGPEVTGFEEEFARFVGAKYAVVVCNATAALHLAMRAAGIASGDRVVTSPNTFLASANCAAFVGATPDFCDIDPVSYNLDPVALEAGWQDDTRAVVPVAYGGQAADLPEIARVARQRGAVVIEDACHGTGGSFFCDGRAWKLGGHPWADMTVFSFHPVKTMTTGEGGIIVTDDADLAERARRLRSHGMERDPERLSGFGEDAGPAFAERGPWVYEMPDLGYNYRITDMQCALGRSQLQKLPRFIQRRREIVARYNEVFAELEPVTIPGVRHAEDVDLISWHLYTVQIEFQTIGITRTDFMERLKKHGIGSQVLYIPVHVQPWYRRTYGYGIGKCPVAEAFYTSALSLPLYPAMTDGDVDRVIACVRKLLDV